MVMDYSTAGIVALIMGLIAVFAVVMIALYVYMGLAFMAIGKKAKLNSPGLAWIPIAGPLIIAFQASKMQWWPWLLIIGTFIPHIGFAFSIAFTVFAVMWNWKMFEKIGRPGWWAILGLIPVVNLVFYGIAAWGKP
jgi:hypothetical protein